MIPEEEGNTGALKKTTQRYEVAGQSQQCINIHKTAKSERKQPLTEKRCQFMSCTKCGRVCFRASVFFPLLLHKEGLILAILPADSSGAEGYWLVFLNRGSGAKIWPNLPKITSRLSPFPTTLLISSSLQYPPSSPPSRSLSPDNKLISFSASVFILSTEE